MGKKKTDKLAGPAKKPSDLSWPLSPKQSAKVRKAVAKLYGRGATRTAIAKAYCEWIVPPRETYSAQVQAALEQLKKWEREIEFRDLVWDAAVVDLDMSTPQILRGVSARAQAGHVDAAKLALAISKRYTDGPVGGAANVNIIFAGDIPRPGTINAPTLSSEVQAIARQAEPLSREAIVEGTGKVVEGG